MLRFKKRIRLLVELLGGKLEYLNDQSLAVRFDAGIAKMTSKSYDRMECSIVVGGDSRKILLLKAYAFDIVDRLSTKHLAQTLLSYPMPPILQLDDYINDEHGEPFLQSLRRRISADPSLVHESLGGNRILAEYYRGVLVLRDDLAMAATNVIESSTIRLRKP